MNIDELRQHCLSVKGASESLPFDENTLVYKVMNKIFAYFSLFPKGGEFFVNMKCNPEKSADLMARYKGITFGYYSDKKYWVSVFINSDVPDALIVELIAHSVDEVVKKLPKSKQQVYFNTGSLV
ncbi:MAG: MmcQ/YjbR family DNA-binding protein [Dysgonamonadaceae bacterium]|jgi:predicted DNA-binding protein (MmcQ/YjbR family)|nr:MmcQ/YjbR family DNA-binding protein [Dysgonamonadaceae bacterium]